MEKLVQVLISSDAERVEMRGEGSWGYWQETEKLCGEKEQEGYDAIEEEQCGKGTRQTCSSRQQEKKHLFKNFSTTLGRCG